MDWFVVAVAAPLSDAVVANGKDWVESMTLSQVSAIASVVAEQ